jgi:hypothetical protein
MYNIYILDKMEYLSSSLIATVILCAYVYVYAHFRYRIYSGYIYYRGLLRDFKEKISSFHYVAVENSKIMLSNTDLKGKFNFTCRFVPYNGDDTNYEDDFYLQRLYLNERMQPVISIYQEYRCIPSSISSSLCFSKYASIFTILYILSFAEKNKKIDIDMPLIETHSGHPDAIQIEHKWFLIKPPVPSSIPEPGKTDGEINSFPDDF